jgi:hypothetical protein
VFAIADFRQPQAWQRRHPALLRPAIAGIAVVMMQRRGLLKPGPAPPSDFLSRVVAGIREMLKTIVLQQNYDGNTVIYCIFSGDWPKTTITRRHQLSDRVL